MIYLKVEKGDFMKESKIQWHSAFTSAMGLDFARDRDDLIFEAEYNLNKKPLQIDLLVIKKEASVQIASEIGKLFKGHNRTWITGFAKRFL